MAHQKHYAYVWEFEVAAESLAEFIRYYGPQGEWARLFQRAEGYLGTWLLQDEANPLRFVTIDRWQSKQLHEAFLDEFLLEYNALDEACESFTIRETSLGHFIQSAGDEPPP
ncbi:MAG: antibiotic biosynthesis monooxygenase [Dokdonella sp.]